MQTERDNVSAKYRQALTSMAVLKLARSPLHNELHNELNDLAIVVNTNGYIIGVNEVWVKIMGYTPGESIGIHYAELMQPEFIKLTEAAFKDLKTTDSESEKYINKYKTHSGGCITLEWYGWHKVGALILSKAKVLNYEIY